MSKIGEFISSTCPDVARSSYERFGRVGMYDLWTPEIAELALVEAAIDPGQWEDRNRRRTEEIALVSLPAVARQGSALFAVVRGIQQGATLIGEELTDDDVSELIFIRMDAGTQGQKHRDDPAGAVAVTNLKNRSEFEFFEDGCVYDLRPGRVIYHNTQRLLEHEGRATEGGERIGLAISKAA